MKPKFLKIVPPPDNSIVIKTDRSLDTPWHYHPEIEILYSIKGKGNDFVGNSVEGIEEGELIMFGENLPHTRLADKEFYENNPNDNPEAVVIQFKREFLGRDFFSVKEFEHINTLLNRAAKGLRFFGETREKIGEKLMEIRQLEDSDAILSLLSILDNLARSEEYILFNRVSYFIDADEKSFNKLNKVYTYTSRNFHDNITLNEVAGLTNHSKAAFCRFFKAHTRKTYFRYLTEVRIANACRLLREGSHDVTRACFASGFNNLSNFNKQFKKVIGTNPTQYLQETLEKTG